MHTYIVGGAVRDEILKRQFSDVDYVVVGATEEEMLQKGYKKVGKSFPVFIDTKTNEEYALARKEIKTGATHKDFEFIFTPDITLEEDSIRRDFTCNAIYKDVITGEIIDYHNGIDDINNRVLRHISPHFAEDPLRVLRMCRFSAELNFSVAKETMELCKKMVEEGALSNLSKDRVWQEFEKALKSPHFYNFVKRARECGLLEQLLPEVNKLWSVPERTDYHPEGNSGEHTMLALKATQSCDSLVNFAVLMHDIGKTKTNPENWPSHKGHNELGTNVLNEIAKRLNVPEKYKSFAAFSIQNHMIYHKKLEENQEELAMIAYMLSTKYNKQYQSRFIRVLASDMQGRAKQDFTKEKEEFSKFDKYFTQIINAIENKKLSSLPDFEEKLRNSKNRKETKIKLLDEYIKNIVRENPYNL